MPMRRFRTMPTMPRLALALSVLALAISLALAGASEDDAIGAPLEPLPVAEAQVELGAAGYAQSCALCHGTRLEGMDHFPPLAGSVFQRRWSERTLGELYTYTFETMPLGAGGSLAPERYAAIVSYLLERNGLPTGETPFDPEDEEQRALPLELVARTDAGE